MATSSLTGSFATSCPAPERNQPSDYRHSPVPYSQAPVAARRRATPTQGRALELLGHAIEYLVDSRMLLLDPSVSAAEQIAARLLMQASRNVFAECAEILPLSQRFKLWLHAPFKSRVS